LPNNVRNTTRDGAVPTLSDMELILLRGLIGFVFLLILARLLGKRQVKQITYFDYIVGITIGSLAAELTFSPDVRMSNFIVGMLIWSLIPMALSKLELVSYHFRKLSEGQPTLLIKNGHILEENLKKERLSVDELMIHLRQKNAFKISDIDTALMETNGIVNVLMKSELQPVTPKTAGITIEHEHMPHLLIIDGNVIKQELHANGYSEERLLGEIRKQGGESFSDVFVAQVDSMGTVYVDLYNEAKKLPEMKHKLITAANIKKLQADLQSFALKTKNTAAKTMYQQHVKTLDDLFDEISVYLKE
jgi:uncharacterized membrane protein YcaP (DUF421 family)